MEFAASIQCPPSREHMLLGRMVPVRGDTPTVLPSPLLVFPAPTQAQLAGPWSQVQEAMCSGDLGALPNYRKAVNLVLKANRRSSDLGAGEDCGHDTTPGSLNRHNRTACPSLEIFGHAFWSSR